MTAQLSGFQPGSQVTLRWNRTTVLSTATADAQGRATARFRVPAVVYGNHTVEAKDATGRAATAPFRVIPRLALSKTSGPSGTVVRVDLYGFTARERVEIRFYDTSGRTYRVLRTLTIGSTGRAGGSVTIPSRSPVGVHRITGRVVGGSRSASANFRVTAGVASRAPASIPIATATAVPPPPAVATPVPTPTAVPPTATAPPSEPPAPTAEPTVEPTQVPTEVPAPTEVPTPSAEPTPVPPPEAPAEPPAEETSG